MSWTVSVRVSAASPLLTLSSQHDKAGADFMTNVLAKQPFERCRGQCMSDMNVDDVRVCFIPIM